MCQREETTEDEEEVTLEEDHHSPLVVEVFISKSRRLEAQTLSLVQFVRSVANLAILLSPVGTGLITTFIKSRFPVPLQPCTSQTSQTPRI